MKTQYDNVDVEFKSGRWWWQVTLIPRDGSDEISFVASAESFYTDESGLYVGTLEEYKEKGEEC